MKEHLKHVSEDVQTIYARTEDNISRQIFESRLLLTLAQRKPDEENYKCCEQRGESLDKVSLFHSGLYDKRGNIGFASGLGGASRVEDRELDTYSDSGI